MTILNNGGGENRAQSFTTAESGLLTKIELPLQVMMGRATLRVSIRSGAGTDGEILGWSLVEVEHQQINSIADLEWTTIDVNAVSVTAGQQYTIHVTEEVCVGGPMDICYTWYSNTTSDDYAGGDFYYANQIYTSNGGRTDCGFRTFVGSEGWIAP